MEQAIEALLHPVRLYSGSDFICRPCPIPTFPGVYAWYFNEVPPGVPTDGVSSDAWPHTALCRHRAEGYKGGGCEAEHKDASPPYARPL